jgi:hypothetical protein
MSGLFEKHNRTPMKTSTENPISRRQKVVDSMAKKFADHGSVEQIIIRHRKKLLRSSKTLYIIIAATVVSMILTGLFTVGIIQPPVQTKENGPVVMKVRNSLDILLEDLDAKKISPDEFVLYCKDYLIRYDSLPDRYKTPFSITSSSEVYGVIVDVWPKLSLRTRQVMLKNLPRIETEQRRRAMVQHPKATGNDDRY